MSKKDKLSDKRKELDKALKGINKKYGEGTVTTVSESLDKLKKTVIPTPSVELNNALYCGGFSGIVELYGNPGSGKTLLAVETIALAQKNDPEFVAGWLETEGSITEDILEANGVDLDRLVYWRQEDLGNAENSLEVSRALIYKGVLDIIVLNSVAGLVPKTEVEDDLEKQNIALVARLLSKYFRGITGAASKNDMTLIFVNQVRENVGQQYGDTAISTGGKALNFYASQRVKMNRLKVMASDPIKESDGVKISCIINKNRLAGKNNPFVRAEYYANYKTGIDSTVNIPILLVEANHVRQSGSWFYYEDEDGNPITIDGIECKFQGRNKFVDAIRESEILRNHFSELLAGKVDSVSDEELAEIMKERESVEKEITALDTEE